MSYTRFSNCSFYTFWDAYSGKTRNTQRLAIYVHNADNQYPCYPEVEDIKTVEQAQALWPELTASGEPNRCPEAPQEDWETLLKVIRLFCEDVEDRYPEEGA